MHWFICIISWWPLYSSLVPCWPSSKTPLIRWMGVFSWTTSMQPHIPRLFLPATPPPLESARLFSSFQPLITDLSCHRAHIPRHTPVWLMRPLLIMASGTGVSTLSSDTIGVVLLQLRKTPGSQGRFFCVQIRSEDNEAELYSNIPGWLNPSITCAKI